MIIHFDTQALADKHLTESCWENIRPHVWVIDDGTCRASTHPACGGTKFAIAFVAIERVE